MIHLAEDEEKIKQESLDETMNLLREQLEQINKELEESGVRFTKDLYSGNLHELGDKVQV